MYRALSDILAEYLLDIMGIATNLAYSLASYATISASGSTLYTILWECVEYLEIVACLKVLYICYDGAIANRKFVKLSSFDNDENNVTYKTNNLYADDNRVIYFISHPPHLLKTARSGFFNSLSHSETRYLWFNDEISWKQCTTV